MVRQTIINNCRVSSFSNFPSSLSELSWWLAENEFLISGQHLEHLNSLSVERDNPGLVILGLTRVQVKGAISQVYLLPPQAGHFTESHADEERQRHRSPQIIGQFGSQLAKGL